MIAAKLMPAPVSAGMHRGAGIGFFTIREPVGWSQLGQSSLHATPRSGQTWYARTPRRALTPVLAATYPGDREGPLP